MLAIFIKKETAKIVLTIARNEYHYAMGRLYGRILNTRIEFEIADIEQERDLYAGRPYLENIFPSSQMLPKGSSKDGVCLRN